MSPVEDFVTCQCGDAKADWCPVHVSSSDDHDTIPDMAAVREIDPGPDDDRFVVPQDLLSRWQSSPEPRIPFEDFVAMFADTGEDTPTSPECPVSKRRDSDQALAAAP